MRSLSCFDVHVLFIVQIPRELVAQTGSIHEPVRYIGGPLVDANGARRSFAARGRRRDVPGDAGQSQPAPMLADDFGWTYNHVPMIVYWNGRFYIEYLSNPVGEHVAHGQSLVCTSTDGRRWSAPQVTFPVYKLHPPDKPGTAMMHQRMGFFIAPDGRLLVLAFYGHAPDPFGPGGIGRVVREIHKDGSFGPVYFLRYYCVPVGARATRAFRSISDRTTKGSSPPATLCSPIG